MSTDKTHEANPGYAVERLWRAISTAQNHHDPAVRDRALHRVDIWTAVLEGMADGTIHVGSRTPVAGTPAWVTQEVAHGGFATGRYAAEGALREHETKRLATLRGAPGSSEREKLNLFFLSDAGQAELREALEQNRYAFELPEEAALLVATWLLDRGADEIALDLIATLRPLMHRLRFYPRITEHPRVNRPGVHLTTVGAVADRLRTTRASPRVVRMNATLGVWNPLYDDLVETWLSTVEGEPPTLEDHDGAVRLDEAGRAVARGGWPGKVWPADWSERRDLFLARYEAAVRQHGASGRHHSPKSNFQLLIRFVRRCPVDASSLSEPSLSTLRCALAAAIRKRGIPGTAESSALRGEQARVAALPLHHHIAHVIAERLDVLPRDEGLDSATRASEPVKEGEHPNVAPSTPIPERFTRKAERALVAPLADLVERGVVSSSEVLAIVLPQISSRVAASTIEHATLRPLFAQTYTSFRRRRSVLLLNLEHQVTIDELPWVAALSAFRNHDSNAASIALQTLRDTALLTFEHFPETIIPNPLLREFRMLARQAGSEMAFVEEIAADIFMGTFTKKFSDASFIASRLLEGTLYGRYYDLPDPLPTGEAGTYVRRWGKQTDSGFDALCRVRAQEAGRYGGQVARNGAVLEQMQILTTYNLASLTHALDLRPELEAHGCSYGAKALTFVLELLGRAPKADFEQLRAVKNAAYGLRQAIFFLSFVSPQRQRAVVEEVAEQCVPTSGSQLNPVIAGLLAIIDGDRFDDTGKHPGGGRRLLGWSCGPHWLSQFA